MSDLDKLMKKLKKDDPVDETAQTPVETPKVEDVPVKAPAQTPELPEKFEDDSDDDDVDEGDSDEGEEKPIDHDPKQTFVENEVGILQNNGIFRRELLLIKKEQLDVLKVMAQLLIDIKKDGKIAK